MSADLSRPRQRHALVQVVAGSPAEDRIVVRWRHLSPGSSASTRKGKRLRRCARPRWAATIRKTAESGEPRQYEYLIGSFSSDQPAASRWRAGERAVRDDIRNQNRRKPPGFGHAPLR